MGEFKPIQIYRTGGWVNKKITYNGKYYTIDDGDDYFLQQIHKILWNKKGELRMYKKLCPIEQLKELEK